MTATIQRAPAPLLSAPISSAGTVPAASTVETSVAPADVFQSSAAPAPAASPLAGNVFPGLSWLNPLSYRTGDESKLPYLQPAEHAAVTAAVTEAQNTPAVDQMARDLSEIGMDALWFTIADQYGAQFGSERG